MREEVREKIDESNLEFVEVCQGTPIFTSLKHTLLEQSGSNSAFF